MRYMYPAVQYTDSQGQVASSQAALTGQNGAVQYAAPAAQPGFMPGYGAPPHGLPGAAGPYQVVTSAAPPQDGTYPQQTYQPPPGVPGGASVPAYPQPLAAGSGGPPPPQGAPPPPPQVLTAAGQQGQGDASTMQPAPHQSFSQYQPHQALAGAGPGGSMAAGTAPPPPPSSFAGQQQQSVPMYYPSPSVASSNGLSVQTSYAVQQQAAAAASQVTVAGQQQQQQQQPAGYRPRSPPSQGASSSQQQQHQSSVNGITVSPSTPQYTYSTSYPQGVAVPPGPPQRVSTPGAAFQAQSPPQAAGSFPLVRPNMQVNMQMAAGGARTSPPLAVSVGAAAGQYLPGQVPTIVHGAATGPGGQPVKFITVDQRVFASTESGASKDVAPNGAMPMGAAAGVALPTSGVPKPVGVRPSGATMYRAPAPINPGIYSLHGW